MTVGKYCHDENGVLRFKSRPVVKWIVEQINLNDLWKEVYAGQIPYHDVKQLYREMGYSVAGFHEVFNEDREKHFKREVP